MLTGMIMDIILDYDDKDNPVLIIAGTPYPISEVRVEIDGEIVESSQDNGDPYELMENADSLALVTDDKRYPMRWIAIEMDVTDILCEMISPT